MHLHYFILLLLNTNIYGNTTPKIIQSPSDIYGLLNQQVNLRCESSDPKDKISWLKDDKVIQTDSKNSLVFQLHPESEGSYQCNVSSSLPDNSLWVVSEKAQVRVAYLHEFQQLPQNVTREIFASPGSTVLLHCPPIDGLPQPTIDWQANISLLDSRFKLDSGRHLRIDSVQRSDSVLFWCRAKNVAATRISAQTRLRVLQKPLFLVLPRQLTVMQGASVLLPCVVRGEPPLLVHWYKLSPGSPSDPSMATALLGHNCSLRVPEARLHHTGAYVARATNRGGTTEIVYRLTVTSPPSFIVTPDNTRVSMGDSVLLDCAATGTPTPTLFWRHGNQEYIVANTDLDNGISSSSSINPQPHSPRITVFDNGTLLIASARPSDAGRYRCYAASVVGLARTQCSLNIDQPMFMFPPIIAQPPRNLSVTEGATVLFPCRTIVSMPTIITTWYKQSLRLVGLNSPRGRLHLLGNGDLKISAARIQDSSIYTCRVSIGGSLYSERSAQLFVRGASESVNDDSGSNSRVPMATRVEAVNISVEFTGDTYLLIKWHASNSRQSAQPPVQHRVEIAAQFTNNWVEVAVTKDTKALITGLRPDTGYKILVRSHSTSVSLLDDVVYTLDKPTVAVDSTFVDFHKALQEIEIFSVTLSSVSSSQLHVSWKVNGGSILRSISGFIIKAEPVPMKRCLLMTQKSGQSRFSCMNNEDSVNIDDLINKYDDKDLFGTAKMQKFVVQRSVDRERTKSSAIVGDLRPFMCYEVEIETFIDHIKAGRISGRDSVTNTVLTYDDLPTKPPKVKKYKWIDNSTFFVSWDRLETGSCNGPIIGYLLQLINLRDKTLQTFKVPIDTLEFRLKVDSPEQQYVLYLSVNSCRGPGPRSWPVLVKLNDNGIYVQESTFLHKPWVVASAVGGSLCTLFLILILIAIFLCKKQKSARNNTKLCLIPLDSSTNGEMEDSVVKRKKNDKLPSQRLLSNYDTIPPNFLSSSDGFSTEHGPSSGTTTVPRFACGSEDLKCMSLNEDSMNDSLAYASSSIIYKGCQHYNQPGMKIFPPNFYGPYIDILNDQRNTNYAAVDSPLIPNSSIPPPPLYPPPPAPKNERSYSENTPETAPNSQNNTHSSGSASACGSSNKSNKTKKSRTPQSVNQSLNSSSSSKSQKNPLKTGKNNRISGQNNSSPTVPGDLKKKDSLSNSTHSSQKTGALTYQAFSSHNNNDFRELEGAQDDQSEAVLTSEISDTDTAPCDLEGEERARDTDSLRVMYKLPIKRPPSPDYSTDSSYPYSLANHYSSAEPTFPLYQNNMPTKF